MNYLNEIFLTLAILLQIGDGVTTWLNLKRPGRVESEKLAGFLPFNSPLKWLMDRIGVIPALLVVKLPATALMVAGVLLYPSTYLTAVLGLVCAGYAYVVWNNWRLLKQP